MDYVLKWVKSREMECIEHASFIEICWSLFSLAHLCVEHREMEFTERTSFIEIYSSLHS